MRRLSWLRYVTGTVMCGVFVAACANGNQTLITGGGSPSSSGDSAKTSSSSSSSSHVDLGTSSSSSSSVGASSSSSTSSSSSSGTTNASSSAHSDASTKLGFLADCTQNSDCQSNLCLETRDGTKKCSTACVSSCTDSAWRCAVVNNVVNPGDLAAACVPKDVNLCKPCSVNDDCRIAGFADTSECVPYWDPSNSNVLLGSFCGYPCSSNTDCSTGYTCEAVTGTTSKQCVKTDRQCSCLSQWATKGYETTCEQHAGTNACKAKRSCGASGLSACTAQKPTAEVCDGIDNDCNGFIDDGGDALCNDNYDCTDNKCMGTQGCQFPVVSGKCLIDGTCYSTGAANGSNTCLECQAASNQKAWSNAASTKSCDDGEVCSFGDHCNNGTCVGGTGAHVNPDGYEPNEDSNHAYKVGSFKDDGTHTTTVNANFNSPSDVDWFSVSITDANNICGFLGGDGACDCLSTKQPQPYATVTGVTSEVCVKYICNSGSTASYNCANGKPPPDGATCCGSSVTLAADCPGGDESGMLYVRVMGSGSACGSYSIVMGNHDSGCHTF